MDKDRFNGIDLPKCACGNDIIPQIWRKRINKLPWWLPFNKKELDTKDYKLILPILKKIGID